VVLGLAQVPVLALVQALAVVVAEL